MTLSTIAQTLLKCYDQARSVETGLVPASLTMTDAIEIQAEIIKARKNRGETPVGYKIGFTNRTIWERYGVSHPIWAPVYDSTLTLLADDATPEISVARFTEPRLEPEIVISVAQTPTSHTVEAISDSIGWVAHGFEIVQSVYPVWQFTAAQSMAAQALHGALLVGQPCPPQTFQTTSTLAAQLSQLTLKLYRSGRKTPVDEGVGSNVLDGPIQALAYLSKELDDLGAQLQPGDIITTGTLTDAQPLAPGQQWRTELSQAGPLKNLTLTVKP